MTGKNLHRMHPMDAGCRKGINELLDYPGGLVIGLTGGIASGKSTVGSMLVERGASLIDFDDLAREVVEPASPALEEIVEIFGNGIMDHDGGLDRKALGRVVFFDPQQRKRLEAVTHPRIFDLYLHKAGTILAEKESATIIAAIPLLFELNLEELFHAVILVHAPEQLQKRRLMERDGISARHAEQILKSQMPIDEKVRRARFVVYNDGGLDETRRRVDALWRELQQMHPCA
ncbi:MAG: dephospho-CoA kinase [Desulfatiglandaceae bacterium]